MLKDPLTTIPGVGKKMAEKLSLLSLDTMEDLLYYKPLRYENHTTIVPVSAAEPGESVMIAGRIMAVQNKNTRIGPMLECTVTDNEGTVLKVNFWHLYPNQTREFEKGKVIACFGIVERNMFGCSMSHPLHWIASSLSDIRLPKFHTPIYSVTKGIKSEKISQLVDSALSAAEKEGIEELIPADVTGGITLLEALKYMHRVPKDQDPAQVNEPSNPYHRRIALEELTANTAAVYISRSVNGNYGTYPIKNSGILRKRMLDSLKFRPTGAQLRVTAEIDADMNANVPMLRLLQGDVGSGKTLVAAMSTLNAIESGYQTAIMAPTEILAGQHYSKFTDLLSPLGITTVLLNGRLKAKEKRLTLEKITSGEAQIVIGTHALFQENVEFRNLAYVIIDEQHRFGVEQRLKLLNKGQQGNRLPHQLVMTATPIPRTLAMTSYADLNVSTIDELPPGRKPVTTKLIGSTSRDRLLGRIKDVCLNQKWQIYWVCPLIEESEVLDCAAAEEEFARLKQSLPELKIGLVHGRMPGDEKQQVMDDFKNGRIDMLVATTVIEVGVDVPNANIIVIEDPQRLGLAQLHQLRGRVGRGQKQSFCMLYSTTDLSSAATERLSFLCNNSDGLRIAEKDLEIRGPGEYLGTKQTGVAGMKIADFLKDQDIISQANDLAKKITDTSPATARKLIERWTKANSAFTKA